MTEPASCPFPDCGSTDVTRGAIYRTDRAGEVFEEGGARHVHPTRAQRRFECGNNHSWFADVAYPCPADGCEHVAGARLPA